MTDFGMSISHSSQNDAHGQQDDGEKLQTREALPR